MKPIAIKPIDDNLEDEDLIEMVNAGLLPYAVVDDHEATIWTKIFPNAVPRTDLVVSEGGEIAWAIRKNSPELKTELNAFFSKHSAVTSSAPDPEALFLGQAGCEECLEENEAKKFLAVIDLFRRYGALYNFDYLMIVAQAYQESELDQTRRGPSGGVGLMQIKPSTAAGEPIWITGVDSDPDRNVRAGAPISGILRILMFGSGDRCEEPHVDELRRLQCRPS